MRYLIYDDNHCKVYVEFDSVGRAIIHMGIDKLTPRIVRETLADFVVVREWLHENGVETVYTTGLANGSKHSKLAKMYGWAKTGEAVVNNNLYAAYEMRTG